ncbi:unnamed protein product, partial [Rotaria magnacalcarata]
IEEMKQLSILLTVVVLLGIFVVPIRSGTCVCTCNSATAGTTSVSCASCTTSYCQSTYASSCGSASSIIAVCNGIALVKPSAMIILGIAMIASLLGKTH